MSDLETQIDTISYVLSEIRDENNHQVITQCLQELENVKKKVNPRELGLTFEKQDNKLLKDYEHKYLQAQQVILELERELEDLKSKEQHVGTPESDILIERSSFWKDKENYQHHTPQKVIENFITELEIKTLHKEKETENDKTQIKQLEEQNAEYQQQVSHFTKEVEELTKNVEEYQIRMSLATKDKSDSSDESSQRKAEIKFLRQKIEDYEKEIQTKNANISALEAKLKAAEDKTQFLATSLNEIMEENETLKTEQQELKEEFKAAYEELKEKVIFKRESSDERKLLITYNNLPLKSPNPDRMDYSDSKSASHSDLNTPQDESLLRTKLEFPSNTKMSNFCPSSICNHDEKSRHESEDEAVIHPLEYKTLQQTEEKTTAEAAKESFSHFYDRQGVGNTSKSSQIQEDGSFVKSKSYIKENVFPRKKSRTFDENLAAGGHLGCCQSCNMF